jgi:hypothetical protein
MFARLMGCEGAYRIWRVIVVQGAARCAGKERHVETARP